MKIKIDKKLVDVLDKKCASRSCFSLGQDKGTFVQGRGYTSYHKEPRWVCMRRHLSGCPCPTVCPRCRVGLVEDAVCSCAMATERDDGNLDM